MKIIAAWESSRIASKKSKITSDYPLNLSRYLAEKGSLRPLKIICNIHLLRAQREGRTKEYCLRVWQYASSAAASIENN